MCRKVRPRPGNLPCAKGRRPPAEAPKPPPTVGDPKRLREVLQEGNTYEILSGAGKSMLLRVLAGVRRPSQGIVACGLWSDIWQDIDAYRRRLAYLPQEDILYPLLTVQENLHFAAILRLGDTLSAAERKQRAAGALELLGLQAHAQKRVVYLSGGQRKRVSVALEWLRQPELFLLDELTAGLDPANETRLMEYLVALARQGTTVVCTTHLMENIYLLDEVLVLGVRDCQGQVAYVGPPAPLLAYFQCRQFADLYERLESGKFPPWDAAVDRLTEEDRAPAAALESSGGQPTPASTGGQRLSLQHFIAPEREIQLRAVKVVAGRSLIYLGGLGLALVVSTLVASEEGTVAWLPILILPQILLSASATGVAPLEYTDARPFRPLAVTLQHPWSAVPGRSAPEPLSKTALVADVLSLVLVCRPGVLLLEQPRVEGLGSALGVDDFCYLITTILGTALVQWVVFLRCERRWLALVGY